MANERNLVRLNRYIAESGITSRRKAEAFIRDGLVLINGKKVFELGTMVDPNKDNVVVDGQPIKPADEKVYLMFFKPKNVVTTMSDPEGRPSLADYVQDVPYRVFPVGRLDWDSEGLLILTNDGDYANRVTHPKFEIPKEYHVKTNKPLEEADLKKLLTGVSIIGGKAKAKEVSRLRKGDSETKAWYRFVITEGKNRQIRRMFEKLGYDVEKLQRMSIGSLELKGVERGEYRILTRKMAEMVFKTGQELEAKKPKRKVSGKRALRS